MPADRADVLVVGAGVAGAVATKFLAERGFRVVCLEQGGWADYRLAHAGRQDFEVTAGRYWESDPNIRQGAADYPVDDADSDVSALMYNGVGGGSVLWAAHWQRFMPSDFATHTLDGVGDDWPFTYQDLKPFYEHVERDFAVAGLPNDPAYPKGKGPPLPPVPLGKFGHRAASAHDQLGWHWWPGSNAIATRPYRGLRACVQHSACMQGCPNRSKVSTDRTHWPEAMALGATLITHARVTEVVMTSEGLADGVIFVDRDGTTHHQPADVTILAANGIGSPRILLMSSSSRFPNGLANSSGLVGRRFMMHPYITVMGSFEEELGTAHAVLGQLASSSEFYETDTARGFVRGAKWALMATGPPLSVATSTLFRNEPAWGEDFHATLERSFNRSGMWLVLAEDLPDLDNRVVLTSDSRDSSGLPGAKLMYKASANTSRMLEFHAERAVESMQAMGASEILTSDVLRGVGHMLGTAVMGTDPDLSVVDPDGRTHDVSNLYVVDGSIWPTSAGVPPTATIAAVALRCTARMVSRRRQQSVPT